MWLWTFFFKKEIKLKQCSFSTKPSTWIMAISTNFKYSKKEWHNNYDARITCHVKMRGLIMSKVALLDARTTTLAMGWTFHCNLKETMLSMQIPPQKNAKNHRNIFSSLDCPSVEGRNKMFWAPLNVEKRSPIHLHAFNIADKQSPWYP